LAGFWRKSRSLKQLVWLSWIAPAGLTLVASLSVFTFLGWLDYQNGIDLTTVDLREKSKVAARRVSAEILLQEHGVVSSVLKKLQKELGVAGIELRPSPVCSEGPEVCAVTHGNQVLVSRPVPQINRESHIVVAQEIKPLASYLNVKFLAWSTLPVFFLIAAGLVIQLVFLRRKVIEPVGSLVKAADAQFEVHDSWPIEVRQIGKELKASFETKEQAVFALLTKGVIHDIKTFMHALLIATDMVGETDSGEKRQKRLENLYHASKSNLPKIKRIIELTLDGSREIPINEFIANLVDTVKGAMAANASYAHEKNVALSLVARRSLMASHDPVQLERAIANLIRNGIEVFPASEWDDTTRREVKISLSCPSGEGLEIAVEDSGSGYLGENNHFMPVKSGKAHGAGLGLYITQKIIHGHGGRLDVAPSDLLGGAKFSIFLPRQEVNG
jgi:signal transduction histidine kinase